MIIQIEGINNWKNFLKNKNVETDTTIAI